MFWKRPFGRTKVPVPIVLYSRENCPLCNTMKRDLDGLGLAAEYSLREIDVDGDTALQDEYGWRVPVLLVADELVSEGNLDAGLFQRRFEKIAARYRLEILQGKNR
ncbi:MAG: glutaredoxin family protein [bacterium]|nr:glutaredoxin family protein [bacterium]